MAHFLKTAAHNRAYLMLVSVQKFAEKELGQSTTIFTSRSVNNPCVQQKEGPFNKVAKKRIQGRFLMW